MDNRAGTVAGQPERDEVDAARQLGLLRPGVSEYELAKLLALRRSWRQAPNALDVSPDARRLTFMRWLVEHGRLSEDDGSGTLDHTYGRMIAASRPIPSATWVSSPAQRQDRPGITGGTVPEEQPQPARSAGARALKPLKCVWSVVCRVAEWVFVPDDTWPGYYESYYRPYTPFPPYPPGRPWPSFNDPLLWRDLRHGR